MSARVASSVAALVAIVLAVGCDSGDEPAAPNPPETTQRGRGEVEPIAARPGRPQDFATVKLIQERYGERLAATFDGVVGHGIGAAEQGTTPQRSDEAFVLVVYLEDEAGRPHEPWSVRGVPLRFVVTGEFRAY